MRFFFLAPMLASAVVAGCADGERQCGSIPADDFCDTLAETYCGRKAGCIGWLEYQTQACIDDILALYEPRMVSVGRGTAVYDGEEAACIAKDVEEAACVQASDSAAGSLSAVVAGSLAAGVACTADWECHRDFFCSFTTQCPGHCAARARDGEPCDTLLDCMSGQCLADHTCGPARVAGETCQDFECGAGLYCTFDAERVCAPRAQAGTPCGYIDSLHARFLCEWRSFCEPTPEGGRCSEHLGEGAACEPNYYYLSNRCSPDLYCNGTQRKCLPLEPAGAPCTSHEQCASYYCSESERICLGTRVCAP